MRFAILVSRTLRGFFALVVYVIVTPSPSVLLGRRLSDQFGRSGSQMPRPLVRAACSAAILESIGRGESPSMAHLLFTQVLDDMAVGQRKQAFDLAFSWYE